jgi:hypothetical protein
VPLSRQPTPIVSPEVQDAAIAEMARRHRPRNATRRTNRFFLLRGLVYCMAPRPDHPEMPCGRRMHGEAPPRRRAFHRCTYEYPGTPERPGGRCKTSVSAEALEDEVWDWVRTAIVHSDDLLRDMGLAQESDAAAVQAAEAAVTAAHRAVEDATAAIDHIVERFEHGKLTEEDYDRLYPKRCEAREMARRRLAEAERRCADARQAGRRWDGLREFLVDLEAKLEEADGPGQEAAEKRAALSARLVERIEIYPDGRKVVRGTLRCVTCELPARVAGGSIAGW